MSDQSGENISLQSSRLLLGPYRLSWVAYVKQAGATLLLLAIGALILQWSVLFGSLWIVIWLAVYLYGFLYLRSVSLFADAHGVWVARGILPWNKGVSGVKWRDLDEAVYFQGFFAWLFKSFRLRIGHRFTKANEIILPNVNRGDSAVKAINQLHVEMVNGIDLDDLARQRGG